MKDQGIILEHNAFVDVMSRRKSPLGVHGYYEGTTVLNPVNFTTQTRLSER